MKVQAGLDFDIHSAQSIINDAHLLFSQLRDLPEAKRIETLNSLRLMLHVVSGEVQCQPTGNGADYRPSRLVLHVGSRSLKGESLALKSKLDLAIEIVDWQHRYATEKLQGVEWCFSRLRELMALTKPEVLAEWYRVFKLDTR